MDNRAIVHFDSLGEVNYIVGEGVQLFVVDERCPGDRVYGLTILASSKDIDAVLGGSTIGSRFDAKHPGIEARVTELITGKPRLTLVDADSDAQVTEPTPTGGATDA